MALSLGKVQGARVPRARGSAPARNGPAETQPRRRSRRKLAFWVAGILVGVGALWVGATALQARGELNDARAGARELRAQLASGDLDAAAATAADVAAHGRRSHQATRGPAWAVASRLPVVGAPFDTFRGITRAADSLGTEALPGLVTAMRDLEPSTLRGADGQIQVDRIAAAAPAIGRASTAVAAALEEAHALPSDTWLPVVDAARGDLLEQLEPLADATRAADLAVRILPPMLGGSESKTYFLAFQNNAEARGTGGLAGAFAVVTADQGQVRFDRFGTDGELVGAKADVVLGDEYDRLYQNAATTTMYGNGNLSPHFPYAAQIWSSMWQDRTGQSVDGVLSLDPGALSYLLEAVGPASLADGTRVTAANVVALTQSEAYTRFEGDEKGRQQFLLGIARAVSEKVIAGSGNPAAVVRALTKAADERRLLAWSKDATVQADLAQTPVGGVVPDTAAPYAGLSIVNEAGNKLDYYLDRSMTWAANGCGPTRDITVTLKLTNNAPAEGLPRTTVAARSDSRADQAERGDHRVLAAYAATAGAHMMAATIDGQPAAARIGSERGHPVFTVDVELPRGESRTVVLHLEEPFSADPPTVLRQPLVRPFDVSIRNGEC